jgi:imidazolonepropionase-like amidohydrolase
MRKAVREQLRQGATQIKLFVSGGVLSPTDPLWMNQFTDAEIRAAVEEAATRRTYVMAHAHTAEAVLRCVQNGVRSIEHGTLMDRRSADAVTEAEAFVVPTLAVVDVLRQDATRLPPAAIEKLNMISDQNAESLALCATAGVKLGFGTDLFGALRDRQCHEFIARGRVQPALDVLRSATSVNAQLLNLPGQIGTVAPGAYADIIGVAGDPLQDLSVLAEPEKHLKLIIRGGEIILNRLTETHP